MDKPRSFALLTNLEETPERLGSGPLALALPLARASVVPVSRPRADADGGRKLLAPLWKNTPPPPSSATLPPMPNRIPRPCAGDPACPNPATYRGRCPLHAAPLEAERNRRRELSRTVYLSARWRRLRKKKLRDSPHCETPRCHDPAVDVDHVTPIEDGGDPWDPRNLSSLCHRHHSTKTAEDVRKRKSPSSPPDPSLLVARRRR